MKTDPVILELRAEVADYQRDVSRAAALSEQKLSAIEAKGFAMGQSLKNSFSLAKTAAVAFAGSIVVSKIMDAARAGLDYASSLGETAQQLGVTTAALQEYRYAAAQSGLSNEELETGLTRLTRAIGEAAANSKGQAAKAFRELGVSVRDAAGNLRNAGDILPDIADGYVRLGDASKQASVGFDVLGRGAAKFAPLLAGGSAALDDLREAAHKLGVVLSDHQIQTADDTADKLAALHMVLSSRIAGAVADNAGAILTMANALATLVTWAGKAMHALQVLNAVRKEGYNYAVALNPMTGPADRLIAFANARNARAERDKLNSNQPGEAHFTKPSPIHVAPPSSAPRTSAVRSTVSAPHASSGSGARPSGPSAAEIALRHAQEIGRLAQDELRAQLELATDADERAAIQKDLLFNEQQQRVAAVENDEHFTRAQKDAQIAYINRLYGRGMKGDVINGGAKSLGAQIIDREHDQQREREASDLAEEQYRAGEDALNQQYDLATSLAERKRLSLAIVEAEYEYRKSVLEAIIASKTATAAEKDRARVSLQSLGALRAGRETTAERANRGPLEAYASSFNDMDTATLAQQFAVDELEHVRDALHSGIEKVTGTKDPLINGLIGMLIDQIVMKPLANALAGAQGGGIVGSLLSGVTSLLGLGMSAQTRNSLAVSNAGFNADFAAGLAILPKFGGGRASGGPVSAGKLYRINEAAGGGRVEGFIPQGGGQIIPLGSMNQAVSSPARSQPAIVQIHVAEGAMFEPRVQAISGDVSVQVVRASARSLADLATAKTLGVLGRQKM